MIFFKITFNKEKTIRELLRVYAFKSNKKTKSELF